MKKRIFASILCISLLFVSGGCQTNDKVKKTSQKATTQEVVEQTEDFDILAELERIEEEADAIELKMQEDATLSQTELNDLATKLYQLWDTELNLIWGRLQKMLTEEEMSKLTEEENEWIVYKETEAEAAGSAYTGGSIQTLIVYQKQAELTRERVYELAEYFGVEMEQPIHNSTEEDYSGLYVDTQGTSSVYSEIELVALEDGTYETTIGLYRITTMEGIARTDGDVLCFEDENIQVKGEIRIEDNSATLTITESGFEYLHPGDVFEFGEKR